MEKFQFFLDQKHTIWYRNRFEVEAETQDEANKIAKEMFSKYTIPDDEWEQLTDTLESLSVKDNGGCATEELYDDDCNMILHNGEVEGKLELS